MARQGIMLAKPFEEKRLSKWKVPYLVQPKIDGDRARIKDGVLVSSEGNEIKSVPHIVEALKDLLIEGVQFDGELVVPGMCHQDIHGIIGRTVNLHPDHEKVEYHIFDLVGKSPQSLRSLSLSTWRKRIEERPCIKVVRTDAAYTMEDIIINLNDYIADGYEGIILRNREACYEEKRSGNIMKLKPMKKDTYPIVGFEQEVDKDGYLKNSLGAFVCRRKDEEKFNVGTGPVLTKRGREDLWRSRYSLIGMRLEIKYQYLTRKGIPRGPAVAIKLLDREAV